MATGARCPVCSYELILPVRVGTRTPEPRCVYANEGMAPAGRRDASARPLASALRRLTRDHRKTQKRL